MSFLREYVPMGLAGIVVLDHSFEESEAGYGSQDSHETVVARKGDGFVKLSVSEHMKFGFNGRRSFGVASEDSISQNEYAQLTEGKEFIDTPEAVQKVREEEESLRRRYRAEDRLNEIAPKCPQCGTTMMFKSGRYGPFWGCPKYPSCNATQGMSAEARNLYKEYAGD